MASQSPWSSGHGLPDAEGLLVHEVREGSPAARAGLAQGDLIVAAGDRTVHTVDDLFDALPVARGDTLELKVIRGADERTIQVVFSASSPPEEQA